MSTQNVETLRRYHELINETGEIPLELFHPQVEIHMFKGSPIAGPTSAMTACSSGAATPST